MMTLEQYNANLGDAVARELGQPIFDRAEDGGAMRAIRAANGGVLPWSPPSTCNPNNSGCELHKAAVAVRTLTSAALRVKNLVSDPRLSDAAKADDAAPIWAEAAAKVDKLLADIEGEAERFAAHESAFLNPPPTTEPVPEQRDAEMRQWFRQLHPDQVPAVVGAMDKGEQPELLAALMRSPTPVPHGVGQALPALWRAHLARTKPDELRAIEARRERLDWLLTVVRQAASAIPRPQATAPVITRQAA